MKKRYFALIFMAMTLLALGCSPTAPIDYSVIREWEIPAGGTGMEILVNESATKEKVLALAAHLREQYSEGYIVIDIFDSLEACTAREIETNTGHFPSNYSEEEYWKHHLVNIIRNPKTGHDEILWVAEGRDY